MDNSGQLATYEKPPASHDFPLYEKHSRARAAAFGLVVESMAYGRFSCPRDTLRSAADIARDTANFLESTVSRVKHSPPV